MIVNKFVKDLALLVLGNNLVVNRQVAKIKKNELTILNLHRVSELDGSAYQPLNPRIP